MALRETIQVRFRPSHFVQTVPDDLVGALGVRLALLASPFVRVAETPEIFVRRFGEKCVS
jgi:hypothetical protein